jgi:hypothetical protein
MRIRARLEVSVRANKVLASVFKPGGMKLSHALTLFVGVSVQGAA